MLKLKNVLHSVGLAKLDPNVPPGLEYFSNLTDVLIKPYDASMDEDFPFLSYFSGKKLKISGNDEQVLFYAVRCSVQKFRTLWFLTGLSSNEHVTDNPNHVWLHAARSPYSMGQVRIKLMRLKIKTDPSPYSGQEAIQIREKRRFSCELR